MPVKLRIPHVFILLTAITFLAALTTYFIPSGHYQRTVKDFGALQRTLVIPGTFEEVPKVYSLEGLVFPQEDTPGQSYPVSFLQFLSAIPRGMEEAADIIFFIFIIGGVFGILRQTGVINASLTLLLKYLSHSNILLTLVIMVVLAACGSTLGMGEEFLPLIPLFLIISDKMGYDRIYGLSLVMLSADIGFAAATTNPFTLNIAQSIAELPLNSGIGFRLIFLTVCLSITIIYLLRYGKKVKNDPGASLVADITHETDQDHMKPEAFKKSHLAIFITGVILFFTLIYGVQELGWWLPEMSGMFFLLGILALIISRMPIHDASKVFVRGMEEMVVAALVVGFARGIQVVLTDGQVLDTLIHSAAGVLQEWPLFLAAEGMFIFQTSLNFLIPSGSGQAAVTMPLMTPLADVLGLSRQVAVFAFTCGDGFSNTIIPTSGILMAMLSLAGIPFTRWLRFMLPLFFILSVIAAIFLAMAVLIGY